MKKYSPDDLTLDMFPENFRDAAELLGMELAYKLCEMAQGNLLYVPMLSNVLRPLVHRDITQAYLSGVPYETLARRHDLSTDSIRRIVRENFDKYSKSVMDFIEELGEEDKYE